jgi:hypothetical protein
MDSGGEEGGKIPIYTREIFVMQAAVNAVCQTLQGCKIITHNGSPK